MRVSIFGLGYVGSVLSACLAESGHEVIGVDVQQAKIDALNRGDSPVLEPGIDPMIKRAVASGTLRATVDASEGVRFSELSLICVGTPSDKTGVLDLGPLERVCADIGGALRKTDHFHSVVFRSTVLPGTTRSLAVPALERESGKKTGQDLGVGYNPEFMREGNAVTDFFSPPFSIVATLDPMTLQRLKALYQPLDAPVIEVPLEFAELLKYVCNGFHAAKITFANEIGALCAALGIDGTRLMDVFCRDTKLNISSRYLRPGFAFGGSCLPKDLRAVGWIAQSYGVRMPLLETILESNKTHIRRAEDLIIATGRNRIGMLGLTFKIGTDDTRESPALILTQMLLHKGCDVWAYEPDLSTDKLIGLNREYISTTFPNFMSQLVTNIRDLVDRADVLVITKSDTRYAGLLTHVRPDHVVVDLVGFFAGQTLPCAVLTLC